MIEDARQDATQSEERGLQRLGQIAGSMRQGGKIRKTGIYKLHRGERVLNKQQAKRFAHRHLKGRQ